MNNQTWYLSRFWWRSVVTEIAKYQFLIVVAVLCLIPFFWVFSTALKSSIEITSTPLGLPQTPTLENFVHAWVKGRMGKYFFNSVIVSVPIVILTVSLSSLAGYAFARHSFAGRKVIFYIFLIGLTLPFQSIMIPLYYTLVEFKILGTYWGMIIPQTALSLSFGVFIMRAFFQGMPAEIEDAARVDGCNEFGVFWRVILPISSPGLVTLGIFSFLGAWNAFLLPLIFMQRDDLRPLSVGLMFFQSRYVRDFGMTMAGATIACLPILIIYIIFQRQFIRGMTAGALKG
jgi:ABC-type glycerol-3-phosphate transport system permease component